MARTEAFLISNLCPVSISLSHESGACVEYLMLAREDAAADTCWRGTCYRICVVVNEGAHHMPADVLIDSFAWLSRGELKRREKSW